MSAIHYKFSSSNDYKNVTFDGLSISVQDCKKAIMEKEKLKMTEVDLLITNAQSLKDYREETALIPKNTALLVRRIPIGAAPASDKSKVYIVKKNESAAAARKSDAAYMTLDQLKKTDDLAAANASEEDKIKAMMDQSTTEYDPSKYLRPPRPGSYQRYDTSVHLPNVKCYKCNQTGHYSTQCRLSRPLVERPKSIRPATGIPRSHMVQVNKDARGAMLTADGQYVVPFIDKKGYEIGKKEKPPFLPETQQTKEEDEDEPVPDELICLLCKEIMEDAVVIPCCGNSYCDECIRNALLESEDHECPTCHKKNISPDSLIANKFLRQAVIKFRNETGISRKKINAPVWPKPAPVEHKAAPPPQPTKLTYGPPKPSSQTSQSASTSGAYVVKARSAQIYAAQGYTIKKATPTTLVGAAPSATTTPTVTPAVQNVVVKPEDTSVTPTSSTLDSSTSVLSSEESAKVLPEVKTEPKISAVNMMVARPDVENKDSPPPPPPPPLPPPDAKEADVVQSVKSPIVEPDVEPIPEEASPEPIQEPPQQAPPPVLDDMPQEVITHFPVQSHGINITLKNPPPVQEKPEPTPIVDPPLNVPMPAQRAALLASAAPRAPIIQQPALTVPNPRIGLPHSGLPLGIPPASGGLLPMRPTGLPIRPPPMPTSLPPPGLLRPMGQRLGLPPPINVLPPGVLPPHLPFPPPVGIPPPRFMPPVSGAPAPAQVSSEGPSAPPPPGTGTPPTLAAPPVKEERKRHERRSSSKSKRENKGNKSPSKSRKSKLALMSDEFTREQKERVASRKRKPRRGRSESRSGSESYSSSSYSSSSSRSSSQSSYSSSGSSSYSSSESSSRSRTPVRRRKKKPAGRRVKKADSQSYSESRSPTPTRKKRSSKVASKHRRDSRSPKRGSRSRRRRSRSEDSPRRGSKYDRRRRSGSRDRRRRTPIEESLIPGMPPQSVLDYERDLALYDYYKQKYEQDWLRSRILPPSPFKRFISYDPTKIPPPNVQPVLREVAPHQGPMPGHPQMGMFSQPPPPGDATPTEEDAGLYAFRDRTPERYPVRQGLGPWDAPMFDGDPAQRARILQEEEYYARMQQKIQGESGWNQRGAGYPDHRFDPRDRPHPRMRDRVPDERDRRRRDRTPPVERGRRSWERDGDRWSARDRRREEDLRKGYRGSRDREKERERDIRRGPRDSRSRREDETRSSRKRAHDRPREAESSRGDSEGRKRVRVTKRTETPESNPPEPFPPGEGDATPVRDESRVEITNKSIKVKVINDKVKPKVEGRKERAAKSKESTSKRGERIRAAADKRDSDSSSRRVARSRGEKPVPAKAKKEIPPPAATHGENTVGSVPPIPDRSPTPTLDENVSPIQFHHEPEEPDVLDIHARASVSEIDQTVTAREPEVVEAEPEAHEPRKIEEKSSREQERRRVKKLPSKRTVTKAKQQRRTESPVVPEIVAKNVEEATPEMVPKSRWESDDEDSQEKSNKEFLKEAEKSPDFKPVKQRKIRIKKPTMRVVSDAKNDEKSPKTELRQKPRRDEVAEKIQNKASPSVASDSRRVVVSNDSNVTEKQTSKASRMLRPSISHTDEATFEPDYDDNDSEKALSNYAPSDFEDDQECGKSMKNGVRKKDSLERKQQDEMMVGDEDESAEERSDEAYEKSKRKKKKKKKKRKKHHRQYDDDDDEEDLEEALYSEPEETHPPKAGKVEKRRDSKQRKYEDDVEMEPRERSRSKKERRHSEKRGKGLKDAVESLDRKRKAERDWEDISDEDNIERRKTAKKSRRSPKEKRRHVSEKDEISLDEDNYSIDDELYRSPTPDERKKYRKKQKHKKNKKDSKNSKEVKSIASRIRVSK